MAGIGGGTISDLYGKQINRVFDPELGIDVFQYDKFVYFAVGAMPSGMMGAALSLSSLFSSYNPINIYDHRAKVRGAYREIKKKLISGKESFFLEMEIVVVVPEKLYAGVLRNMRASGLKYSFFSKQFVTFEDGETSDLHSN